VIATVVHLVNSGMIRLGGNFRGAHFDATTADASGVLLD